MRDRAGEAVTRYNIAVAYINLRNLGRPEEELSQVVALDEAIGHPDLESDRAVLAQVQARRKQAGESEHD